MKKIKTYFPGYRFGPNGEYELFQSEEDVPAGWTRKNPAKHGRPAEWDEAKPKRGPGRPKKVEESVSEEPENLEDDL